MFGSSGRGKWRELGLVAQQAQELTMVQADAQVEAQVSETLRIHGRIQAGGGGVTVSHGE